MSVMWNAQTAGMQQFVKYAAFGLPVVISAAVWNFPAAMCYYWTCSNVYSILLDLSFRVPSGAHPCAARVLVAAQRVRLHRGHVLPHERGCLCELVCAVDVD